jgi:exodeoxyribonuclease V alpha subunit
MSSYGIPADTGTGVFNGDIGVITAINKGLQTVTVEYDEGKRVVYPYSGLDELELAYAVTIHKSQGSEYPAVVIPLLRGPEMLMNRNLIYTAITRASKCVVLVGHPQVFVDMIQNTKQTIRYSGLQNRILDK